MLSITIRDGARHYLATVSPRWARGHDNGALVSCGLTVGENLSRLSLEALRRRGRLEEISAETANHSSCLSRCVLRGDSICQW